MHKKVLVDDLLLNCLLSLMLQETLNVSIAENIGSIKALWSHSFVHEGTEIFNNQVDRNVLVGTNLNTRIFVSRYKFPFGYYENFLSQIREFDIGIILSEVIDSIFCEVTFNIVLSIAQPNGWNIFLDE
jgi:hypothetical protein